MNPCSLQQIAPAIKHRLSANMTPIYILAVCRNLPVLVLVPRPDCRSLVSVPCWASVGFACSAAPRDSRARSRRRLRRWLAHSGFGPAHLRRRFTRRQSRAGAGPAARDGLASLPLRAEGVDVELNEQTTPQGRSSTGKARPLACSQCEHSRFNVQAGSRNRLNACKSRPSR